MRAVNLLPRDTVRRTRRTDLGAVPLVALAGTALVATVLTLAFVNARNTVDEKRAELERVQMQLDLVPRPRPAATTSPELAAARAERATAVASALAERVAWDRVLRRFALLLPGDVWLTKLTATTPEAGPGVAGESSTSSTTSSSSSSSSSTSATATAGAPEGFTIEGHAYSHAGVARLISRLDTLPDLTDVQLQTSELEDLAGRQVVKFVILADVRRAEEAP